MGLSPAFLDELRQRTLLSALVAKTVKLQRKGREFAACCPFHNEKTPSFYVNDEKGFYHCFGCGAHGDAIRWMTDQRGLPFIDAVKELAQAAGLDLPAPDAREAARAERAKSLHDVMAAAAAWFEEQYNGLPGAAARVYVEKRGVTETTRKAFSLGYAPDSKTGLRRALEKFGDSMLIEAGLLIEVEGKEPYDRFRDRLMIPIRDARGRVIAFGGRIIGQGEPKYLNSPDTPLFDKGRTLYNLDRAAPAARKSGRMIVVEGYLDVIVLAQAGIGEAVAPLGTALTEFQIERLWRQVDAPLLCFDGDSAGQKAAFRAATRALPGLAPGRSLAFLTLPAGLDPDDLVRTGGARAFENLAATPEPLVDRLWNHEVAAEPLATPEQRAGLRKRLNELVAAIADNDVRQQYQAEFRERFDTRFLQRPAFQRGPRPPFRPGATWQPPRPISPEAKGVGSSGIDRRLLKGVIAGLLRYPDLLAGHAEALHGLQASDPAIARLLDALVDLALEEQALDTERLHTILRSSEFDALARDLLRADRLRFSFTKQDADPERAKTDLAEVIQAMVEQPEIEAALQSATERFMRTLDEEDRLEQQRLRELRDENARRLANLMQDDEGA
jgi:DNA primase